MAVAGQKYADCRPQSQSDSERHSERAERALFDLILGIVNQIFRRAAALFDSALCRDKFIFDRINNRFLHAFDFGSQLITDFYSFFEYLGLHCYFLLDS
jgi:hypothetical protein